jgi:hypothetical protein
VNFEYQPLTYRRTPSRYFALLGLWAMLVGGLPLAASDWTWEGSVEYADPRLAPTLRQGLVVAGSVVAGSDSPLFSAELQVDWNFVPVYAAASSGADGRWVWTTPESTDDAASPIAASEPVLLYYQGTLDGAPAGDGGLRAVRLELWLRVPATGLAARLPEPLLDDRPLRWLSGWFRLAFSGREPGDHAELTGLLTVFQPTGDEPPLPAQVDHLQQKVAWLGQRLNEQELTTARLQQELTDSRGRLLATYQTLDYLALERTRLEQQVAALQDAVDTPQREWQRRAIEWEVREALLLAEQEKLQAEAAALAEQLSVLVVEHALTVQQAADTAAREANEPLAAPETPAGAIPITFDATGSYWIDPAAVTVPQGAPMIQRETPTPGARTIQRRGPRR